MKKIFYYPDYGFAREEMLEKIKQWLESLDSGEDKKRGNLVIEFIEE